MKKGFSLALVDQIFTFFPNSYSETIGQAILLGGDTYTIAAMAGSVSGAFLGREALPESLLERLEDSQEDPESKGRAYFIKLSENLRRAWEKTSLAPKNREKSLNKFAKLLAKLYTTLV